MYKDGLKIKSLLNLIDIPAPNASILVARAILKRQNTDIQLMQVSSFFVNALFRNLIAKYKNIEKTIHFENIFS